jgi:prepilin-type N-terminal cleavage/methylation domain-containing protein
MNRHHGVSLVELLIALAICAALLTATGFAVDSAFKGYAINQEQASLQQRARLAINRLQTYIRTTEAHVPLTDAKKTQFTQGTVVTDTGIKMLDDSNNEIDFKFDSTTNELQMVQAGQTHVLLRDVTTFTVKMEPMKSPTAIKTGGAYDLLMRATIQLSVKSTTHEADETSDGMNQIITLVGSVMPRRNIWG